jgi:amidophosphoribosyltransferase
MSGIFALSVGQGYKGNFLEDLFRGTFYNQHLGEEDAGLSRFRKSSNEPIKTRTHRGLFRPNFADDLGDMEGTEAIGFCGSDREPFSIDSRVGEFSVCFSGNIINRLALVEELKRKGFSFERRGDDIEIIAKLIAKGDSVTDGILKMASQTQGAFSLLVLTKNGIHAALCPSAQWPLVVAEKEGTIAVSSESAGFSNLGFSIIRDLEPGEIIHIRNGEWTEARQYTGPSERPQFCSFVWVYTGSPASRFRRIPISLVRKRLGASLARKDIEAGFIPDIVIPVPDSGRFHAIGYFEEFCRQFQEGRHKYGPHFLHRCGGQDGRRRHKTGEKFPRHTEPAVPDRDVDSNLSGHGDPAERGAVFHIGQHFQPAHI